jgi:hypothetical protein
MLMNSGSVSQNLNCRAAAGRLVNWTAKKIKEIDQEMQRPTSNNITHTHTHTHTTLWCCFALLTGKWQKTGVLGARQVSRGRSKARLWPTSAYRAVLLLPYINSLISRHPLVPALTGES